MLARLSAALVLLLAIATVAAAQQKPLRPFTFILDFLPYGEYTPYFTALDKGWYREEGLDVKILRGAGGGDTIKRIAVGQGDAGSADFSGVVAAKANEDIKVRAIGAYFRRPPHSIFVREGTGINGPKDLAGKTLSITPGNSHAILFPLLAKLNGFPADSVKWVTMDGAAMGPALITGRVDGAPFFANHEARLQKQAKAQGITLKRIAYADSGFDMYSLVIFAREDAIAKEPEPLKAFLRGTVRGLKYAFAKENHAEGAKILLKYHPEVDYDAALGAAMVASTYSMTEEVTSGKVAVGQFEPARVDKSRDVYTEYMQLKKRVPGPDLYTNDLLPERK
ncbi:MAG: ABC transporter substrate-binding protein [Candidatus Rokubacteria bacterium]|nr:ABC transporter substrate-binding protein [Candidatus Rokubacteria bacterium]